VPEEEKSIPQVLTELWEMLVAYGKQETVEPLRGLGRYLVYGVAAAVFGSLGILLLTLGGVRALQTHNDEHLNGNWNWVPYAAGLALLLLLIVIAVRRIRPKGSRQ